MSVAVAMVGAVDHRALGTSSDPLASLEDLEVSSGELTV